MRFRFLDLKNGMRCGAAYQAAEEGQQPLAGARGSETCSRVCRQSQRRDRKGAVAHPPFQQPLTGCGGLPEPFDEFGLRQPPHSQTGDCHHFLQLEIAGCPALCAHRSLRRADFCKCLCQAACAEPARLAGAARLAALQGFHRGLVLAPLTGTCRPDRPHFRGAGVVHVL